MRRAHARRAPVLGALLLAVTALTAAAGPAHGPASAAPDPGPATPIAHPEDVQKHLEKAGKALDKAERAVRGNDPGRVTLVLSRLDEELGEFEQRSRLAELIATIEGARREARGADPKSAVGAVLRLRALYPALADYTVLRLAEESSRAALRGAQSGDSTACLEALDRFDGSILPRVLARRVQEAREAVARARSMMVRRDMAAGRQEVAAVRRALDGLRYAGDLGRAQFSLRVGSELLEQGALLAARDQIQKALRDLRDASELGPAAQGPQVERARDAVEEVWRRATRPQEGDAARIGQAADAVEEIRRQQADHS